jgi:hypothetical protein
VVGQLLGSLEMFLASAVQPQITLPTLGIR